MTLGEWFFGRRDTGNLTPRELVWNGWPFYMLLLLMVIIGGALGLIGGVDLP